MTHDRATTLRRALLALACMAGLWAILVMLTGGFATRLAGVRVSSRNARNPILLALISACAALVLSGPNRGSVLTDDLRWWWSQARMARRRLPRLRGIDLVALIAVVGATLRIYEWASARPLWLDEEMIALNIRDRSLAELAGSLWLGQSAPFGWLATERAAMLLLGVGESAVRLVPLLFGLAILAAALWMARRWMTVLGASALVGLFCLGQWLFHYSLELKHYSADAFFGLLLPALVVWVIEAEAPHSRLRRAAIWWALSASGLWWANGVVFVTPACALMLWISLWRIDGPRSAVAFVVFGFGWLASFGLHYLVTLRFTLGSGYLREAWSFAMPPASASVAETVRWLIGQAAPLATRPGGTELAALFWTVALGGFLFARPRMLGYTMAAAALSACALAAIRLVPLYERFSLWAVPAIYIGIALWVDAGVRWGRDAYKRGRRFRATAAAVVVSAGLWLCVDIGERGRRDIVEGRPRDSNHQLDDRTAVRWLLAHTTPGDAVLTTLLALPAVWWYGGALVSPPASGSWLPDGSPIFEVAFRSPGPECADDVLRRVLAPYKRALVYFGFRFDDVPEGFDDLLLRDLERIGRVTVFQHFAGVTRAAIVELDPVQRQSSTAEAPRDRSTRVEGCVSVRPATRW